MRNIMNVAFIVFVVLVLFVIFLLFGCEVLDGQAIVAAGDAIVADVNAVGDIADTVAPAIPGPGGLILRTVGTAAAGIAGAWVIIRGRAQKSKGA